MFKGQKSVRNGIEDFLCPFTDMYITQGANGSFSHKGTMANDVRGLQAGVRYPYYAPCDVKCIWIYPNSGQACWQSLEKVRFANGKIDYATFMTAHDESFNAKIGQIVRQGEQLGNMGKQGNATGVHCHIEISQTKCSMSSWHKNKYGIYCFDEESDTDDSYFVDNTNIIYGMGGAWKHTTDVPVQQPSAGKNYVNLPPIISKWAVYDINVAPVKANAKGYLNPQKFGGLTYYVYEYRDGSTTAVIQTQNFGKVKIYIKDTCASITIDNPTYEHGNY